MSDLPVAQLDMGGLPFIACMKKGLRPVLKQRLAGIVRHTE